MFDFLHATCLRCYQGTYEETSIHCDWDGCLHCTECKHKAKRHVNGILVGSTALKAFNMSRRHPLDQDFWLREPDPKAHGDNKVVPKEILDLVPTVDGMATPDAVYTIKCSHAVYDINWTKTKQDMMWLHMKGCKIIQPLYDALVEYWKTVHGDKAFLSLNKNKEQFFNDAVTYVYPHDYLHALVAYPNRPLYESVLKDGHEVLVSKEKFDTLPFEKQVQLFREEIAVIATERWLVNPINQGKISWYKAYFLALQKTVTSLTKGWASEFIVMNMEAFTKPKFSEFKHVLEKLNIEEIIMGKKVDLSVFEDLIEALDIGENMDHLLSALSHNLDNAFTRSQQTILKNEYNYELIENNGGGEGGGEYCTSVFRLKDKFYRTEFSYASYEGFSYDGIEDTVREVKPVEKLMTVYE